MEPKLPWYQSAIVRQQIVQIVVAATALFGVNLGDFDVDATLVSIFAGIAGVVGVWTLLTRLFKPAPPMTDTAAAKAIDRQVKLRQGGFFRASLLVCLALASCAALVVLPGCASTKAAYEAARETDNAVADTAYVVTEHYAAVVREAADLAALPTTSESVKDALKAADRAVKPLIVGNPDTGAPGVRQLAARYTAVKSAANQAELQAAINAAVLELAKLINAVKTARSPQ